MAGLGSRFPRALYPPKPLIKINGSTMIEQCIDSLGLDGNYIFVLRLDENSEQIKSYISSKLKNATIVEIMYLTDGPACTALLCKEMIDNDEELVIANCDQIMEWDPKLFLHNARLYDGCVVTYHTDTIKNSYAKINKQGLVTEVKEKVVISNLGLNGIHYWKKGSYFVNSAEAMIDANERAGNNEFYVAPTYNYMIKQGLSVGFHHIPNQQHHAVGTPEDLEIYLKK
jgi:NDP-sugar pyrophosphorylase family protein